MSSPYRKRGNSPYQIIRANAVGDVLVTRAEVQELKRPTFRQYVSTPADTSLAIIEVVDDNRLSRSKSNYLTVKDVVHPRSSSTPNVKVDFSTKPIPTMSGALSGKIHRTSSRTGILYFAFGSHLSPTYFRSDVKLRYDCSSRPVALARLNGWQWTVSSRGVPNIVPLRDNYSSSRTRGRYDDEDVVYGLIYNLDHEDENKVDARFGYKEHGPINLDTDLTKVARRPFAQGINENNKRYERVEIVEWFVDPSKEGINAYNGSMETKCLMYVDESAKGTRSGDIWDDEADAVSIGVTKAVQKYGLSKRWVENVMGEYGICVVGSNTATSRSSSRPRDRLRRSRSEGSSRRSRSRRSSDRYESEEDDTVIETRIIRTTVEGWEPFAKSGFYREKWGTKKYVTA